MPYGDGSEVTAAVSQSTIVGRKGHLAEILATHACAFKEPAVNSNLLGTIEEPGNVTLVEPPEDYHDWVLYKCPSEMSLEPWISL